MFSNQSLGKHIFSRYSPNICRVEGKEWKWKIALSVLSFFWHPGLPPHGTESCGHAADSTPQEQLSRKVPVNPGGRLRAHLAGNSRVSFQECALEGEPGFWRRTCLPLALWVGHTWQKIQKEPSKARGPQVSGLQCGIYFPLQSKISRVPNLTFHLNSCESLN